MAQINKPDTYFNTKLYTGNGTTDTAITGVGFQPDWTVIKRRNSAGGNFNFDVIRGATKRIAWNETSAEETQLENLKSFDSDGFTLGNASGVNGSGDTHVAWNWLASNTTASNTDGSITSTVSANTTSGFSIVSYTGTGSAGSTVGHSLGQIPKVIIIKNRSSAVEWGVYVESLGSANRLALNTNASSGATSMLNSTDPTSSVFTLGTASVGNSSGNNYVAYCFNEKKGFSKFGSWTGADGAFIYTGFKPAFILGKNASNTAGYDWWIFDNKRDSFNDGANNLLLRPNASDTEATFTFAKVDFLSNGFKIYGTDNTVNGSGNTMIYMAFAESPLVGTNNTPATAR